jgi:hypothetical protein
MRSRQAETLLSAFADCSGKLATAQSVSLANQIHDCAAVLNLRFARLSVCQLSPVTMQDAHNRSRVQLADELPKDVFPHLSPQIAAHGFRRMTAISQSCFRNFELLTSQGALTP